LLGVGKFLVAAVVAAFVDQFLGSGKIVGRAARGAGIWVPWITGFAGKKDGRIACVAADVRRLKMKIQNFNAKTPRRKDAKKRMGRNR
jgi:hypothetical protein